MVTLGQIFPWPKLIGYGRLTCHHDPIGPGSRSEIQRPEVLRSAGGKLNPIKCSSQREPASINETIMVYLGIRKLGTEPRPGPDPHPSPRPHPRFAGPDRGWGSHPRFAGDRGSTPTTTPDKFAGAGIGDHPHPRFPSGVPCPQAVRKPQRGGHTDSEVGPSGRAWHDLSMPGPFGSAAHARFQGHHSVRGCRRTLRVRATWRRRACQWCWW